jgi:proline iminopeptidase
MENPEFDSRQWVDRGDGHRLWYATGGPATAPAVLVIHGGPGGRSRAAPLQWLGGRALRWLCWDQRGCGRSEAADPLQHNTLAHTLADIDALLDHCGVASVALLAGSWGAVVALEYLRTRPQRVNGLLLRSAFLGSDAEVNAFFAPWAGWAGAAVPAPLSQPGTVACNDGTGKIPAALAQAWRDFEALQSRAGGIAPNDRYNAASAPADEAARRSFAVQLHYLRRHCFLPPQARERWQRALPALRPGPIAIVHGDADATCPAANSAWLASLWPQAEWCCVEGAGHAMGSEPMQQALRAVTGRWADQLLAQALSPDASAACGRWCCG